jgi:hypothetical protein
MWGYQLHDRPVLDTLIQPPETSSSNYQRLSWRSREKRVRNGRWILLTSTYRARRFLLHAVNLRHGTDGFTSPPKEGVLRILTPLKSIVLGRFWNREPWVLGLYIKKIKYNNFCLGLYTSRVNELKQGDWRCDDVTYFMRQNTSDWQLPIELHFWVLEPNKLWTKREKKNEPGRKPDLRFFAHPLIEIFHIYQCQWRCW